MCGDINCLFPRRRFSRVRITKNLSQLLEYLDRTKMKFCGLRPLIGPGSINDKIPHEPRSGLTVRYLGDPEKRKVVTRLHFAIPVQSEVFAHRRIRFIASFRCIAKFGRYEWQSMMVYMP